MMRSERADGESNANKKDDIGLILRDEGITKLLINIGDNGN